MSVQAPTEQVPTPLQIALNFVVSGVWGAVDYAPSNQDDEKFGFIARRENPLTQGAFYILTPVKKGELAQDVSVGIISEKDNRPSVQVTVLKNGLCTIQYAGDWSRLQGAVAPPSLKKIKVSEGDKKSAAEFDTAVKQAAFLMLSFHYGQNAAAMHRIFLRGFQDEVNLKITTGNLHMARQRVKELEGKIVQKDTDLSIANANNKTRQSQIANLHHYIRGQNAQIQELKGYAVLAKSVLKQASDKIGFDLNQKGVGPVWNAVAVDKTQDNNPAWGQALDSMKGWRASVDGADGVTMPFLPEEQSAWTIGIDQLTETEEGKATARSVEMWTYKGGYTLKK